jgi:hypothetical protein
MTSSEFSNIINPAKGLLIYNTTINCHQTNVGDNVSSNWQCLISNTIVEPTFFYMPIIILDTSILGTGFIKDLYAIYSSQFSTPSATSPGAPSEIPIYSDATDLYYYISSYDISVFDNVSVTATGIMSYDVIDIASSEAFINIVFVPK